MTEHTIRRTGTKKEEAHHGPEKSAAGFSSKIVPDLLGTWAVIPGSCRDN
jgi:hypothetical protein